MEKERIIAGIVLMAVGAFLLWASLTEQGWFYNNYKARRTAKLLGHTGTKILYAVIGILFAGIGIYVLIFGM